MWPYILCFSISCLCFYVAEIKRNNNYKQFVFFSIIGIILPCLLAGARDKTIGTDVLVYGDRLYNLAKNLDFFSFIAASPCEFLYSVLVYGLARITITTFWQYFIFQLIVVVCIYIALIKQDTRKVWIGMAGYYLMFYGYSLNWMRQMIAMSIIFFAYLFIKEEKLIKYIIMVIIATLFHSSAIIAILFYPMYYLLTDEKISKYKNIRVRYGDKEIDSEVIKNSIEISIIGLFIVALFSFYKILLILSRYSYFALLYGNYFEKTKSGGSLDITYIILIMPVVITGVLYHKKLSRLKTDFRYIFSVFAIGYILYQTKMYGYYSYRISFYFLLFIVILIPKVLTYTVNRKNAIFLEWSYVVIFSLYFYLDFVKRLSNEIIPYTSKMLGIG